MTGPASRYGVKENGQPLTNAEQNLIGAVGLAVFWCNVERLRPGLLRTC